MLSKNDVILVTSIAPGNIENQCAAMNSWLLHGFSVVSLNTDEEINQLQALYKKVIFHPVKRDARAEAGKPLVYLDDIFFYLGEYGTDICGIVNSDIRLRADENFLTFVREQANNAIVMNSRVEVDFSEQIEGKVYIHGFDVFFFDKQLLAHFPPSKFCIGLPWWDYFIPSIAFQKGLHVKYLLTPVGYHVKHQIRYSTDSWEKGGIRFIKFFNAVLASSYEEMLKNNLEQLRKELHRLSFQVIQNVQQYAEKIEYKSLPPNLTEGGHGLEEKSISVDIYNLNNQGAELLGKGDTQGALNIFIKILDINPNFASAHNNLAILYWQIGQPQKAADHFSRALQLAPDDRNTVLNCVELLKFYSKIEDAKALCSSFLKRHPEDEVIGKALTQIQ